MEIEIEIDELVLHGFPPGDRYRIGEAVQTELARIFVERGLSGNALQDVTADRLDSGTFNLTAGAAAVGSRIAAAVHQAVVAAADGQGASK
jgi:hypothetical protein